MPMGPFADFPDLSHPPRPPRGGTPRGPATVQEFRARVRYAGAMSERITGEEQTMAVSEGAPSPVLSLPPPTTPARHVFGARYEILGLVGAGGMGTVYRARDKE